MRRWFSRPPAGASPSLFDETQTPVDGTTRTVTPDRVRYKTELEALQAIRAAADDLRVAVAAEYASGALQFINAPETAKAMAFLSLACTADIDTPTLSVTPADNGTATSRAAALKIAPKAGSLRKKVLLAIANSPRGMTDALLEQHLQMSHQTVSARRRELVLGGFVKDSGQTRKNPSGAAATIWVATVAGHAEAANP